MRIAGSGKDGADVGGSVGVMDGVGLGVDVGVIVAVGGKGVALGSADFVSATMVGTLGVGVRVSALLQLVRAKKISAIESFRRIIK